MSGVRRAAEVLLGVLITMAVTTRAALAKGYIDLGQGEGAPLSPRVVEGPAQSGGGAGPDVSSTVSDGGITLTQVLVVAAVVALALAIVAMGRITFKHRHHPLGAR